MIKKIFKDYRKKRNNFLQTFKSRRASPSAALSEKECPFKMFGPLK
jgi:hypothetical protein